MQALCSVREAKGACDESVNKLYALAFSIAIPAGRVFVSLFRHQDLPVGLLGCYASSELQFPRRHTKRMTFRGVSFTPPLLDCAAPL